MRSLGDKISSTIVAQSAGVPTLNWSGMGLTGTDVDPQGHVRVPDEVYNQATVTSISQGQEAAERIGYPIMIKASEGGGGKGIRRVTKAEEFASAYAQVESEIPGSPIFLMRLAGEARHLEVQLLADQYGTAISLFGRDCSVQRRHQKIIEEAPVTVASPEVTQAMEEAAVRLAQLVGYVSAGTVEYLYHRASGQFHFLELNPRLQVEHPTTEMVSGVNLPAAQLQVAMGLPLHRLKDLRLLYGVAPTGSSPIDFSFSSPSALVSQRRPQPKGHVIAVRITAENPEAGFKPSGGRMQELNFRSSSHVWGYFSVGPAGGLHEYADSQFGHVFSFGEDRSQARANMALALRELSIRGDFRTTVEYLIRLLETQAFTDNTIDTAWLDLLIGQKDVTAARPQPLLAVLCAAAWRAYIAQRSKDTTLMRALLRGHPPPKGSLITSSPGELLYEGIKYRYTVSTSSHSTFTIYMCGGSVEVGVRPLADGGFLILLDGKAHSTYWRMEGGGDSSGSEEPESTEAMEEAGGEVRGMIDGRTCILALKETDPTQLRATSPGKLTRILVPEGGHVQAGKPYAEMEVMKMCLPLLVPASGQVRMVKTLGATISSGDLLGVVALDDPGEVKHARPYEGPLPSFGPAAVQGDRVHHRFSSARSVLESTLDGYATPISAVQSSIQEMEYLLSLPSLPKAMFLEGLSNLQGRLPSHVQEELMTILANHPGDEADEEVDEEHDEHEEHEEERALREEEIREDEGRVIPPSSSSSSTGNANKSSLQDEVNEEEESGKKARKERNVFPERALKAVLDRYIRSSEENRVEELKELYDVLRAFSGGLASHRYRVLESLLGRFYQVESLFEPPKKEEDSEKKALTRKKLTSTGDGGNGNARRHSFKGLRSPPLKGKEGLKGLKSGAKGNIPKLGFRSPLPTPGGPLNPLPKLNNTGGTLGQGTSGGQSMGPGAQAREEGEVDVVRRVCQLSSSSASPSSTKSDHAMSPVDQGDTLGK